ncbi:hypothetical protein HK097_003531, partial [Rhizophlyctis rosea]
MPVLGLGTYRLKGETCRRVVREAVLEGYRLIDTASVYKNEEDIGIAIAELINGGVVRREELFVTTKISPRDQGTQKAHAAALESLRKLGPAVGYIDLLLIHWPGTAKLPPTHHLNATNRLETYTVLEHLLSTNLTRSIG